VDTLERAIRSALEKGNADDRAYREKVYQSAFTALDRALNSPNVSPENAAARRTSLQETIIGVEGEYLAAAPMPRRNSDPLGVQPQRESSVQHEAYPDAVPSLDPVERHADQRVSSFDTAPGATRSRDRQEPELGADWSAPRLDEYRIDADLDETVRGEPRSVRRKRRPFALLFVLITALAVLTLAAWWIVGSGLLLSDAQRDGSVPNPSPVQEEEGFDPANPAPGSTAAPRLGSEAEDPNAITLFTPGDQDDFTVPGDAVAQLSDQDGSALRIRSGQSGSAIAFNVPQAVLQQLAGRRALFVVSAQAEDGQSTQISISCSFGELGDCGGRQRFDVTGERGDVIFDVDLPDVQPGSDGTIAIVSDVGNNGQAVDIFSIRVSPAS